MICVWPTGKSTKNISLSDVQIAKNSHLGKKIKGQENNGLEIS